jgi:hypothetical protein
MNLGVHQECEQDSYGKAPYLIIKRLMIPAAMMTPMRRTMVKVTAGRM